MDSPSPPSRQKKQKSGEEDFIFSSNDDIAIEVLSRLPAKDLLPARCISKTWNHFIFNDHAFLKVHFQRWTSPSAFFFQCRDSDRTVEYYYNRFIMGLSLADKHPDNLQNFYFDFLPEAAPLVLMASSNGLLCCRTCVRAVVDDHAGAQFFSKKRKNGMRTHKISPGYFCARRSDANIYVCNPISKQWIALEPTPCGVGDYIGLAVYPFGPSQQDTTPCFKLVVARQSRTPPPSSPSYSFSVYSSLTGKWKASDDLCYCDFKIKQNSVVSVGHRFHWLTYNHCIITFDLESELPAITTLPGPIMEIEAAKSRMLIGNSQGHLHYLCVNSSGIRIWMLKDHCRPTDEWVLKHNLNLVHFCNERPHFFSTSFLPQLIKESCMPETARCCAVQPLAFHEEVLCMRMESMIYSYCFETGRLCLLCSTFKLAVLRPDLPTVLPYSDSLASLNVLKGNQKTGAESNGMQNHA